MDLKIIGIFHQEIHKGFNIKAAEIIDSLEAEPRGGSLSFRIAFLKYVNKKL